MLESWDNLNKININRQGRAIMPSSLFHPSPYRNLLEAVMNSDHQACEKMLTKDKEAIGQTYSATDLSGRTFSCTPVLYALWARDVVICKLLFQNKPQSFHTQLAALESPSFQHGNVADLLGVHYRLKEVYKSCQETRLSVSQRSKCVGILRGLPVHMMKSLMTAYYKGEKRIVAEMYRESVIPENVISAKIQCAQLRTLMNRAGEDMTALLDAIASRGDYAFSGYCSKK